MNDTVTEVPVEDWDVFLFWNELECFRGERTKVAEGQRVDTFMRWHSELQRQPMHPSVVHMIERHKPADYRRLALEYPRISKTDELRLAYTRSAMDGENERHLITSIGKYLSRHWPHVADHVRRDAQALYTPDMRKIVHTIPDFVISVEVGPRSCMASIHGSIPFTASDNTIMRAWMIDNSLPEPTWSKHPYSAYLPELGWSMAQRWHKPKDEPARLDGRALIYTDPRSTPSPTKGVFVRTYARNKGDPVSGWSETDHALQTWLEGQGYKKVDAWPHGAELYTPVLNQSDSCVYRIKAPYIDGSHIVQYNVDKPGFSTIDHDFDHSSSSVHFDCANTNGTADPYESEDEDADDDENYFTCNCCDGRFHDDERQTVGRDEDVYVCEGCLDDDYTEVRGSVRWGRNGEYDLYYVHNDNEHEVERPHDYSFSIDIYNVPGCVVQLECGEYAHEEDAVYCNSDSEYYLADDERIVSLEDGYGLREDCVEISGEWYEQSEVYEADDGTWFVESTDCDAHNAALVAAEAPAVIEETEVAAPVSELAGTTAHSVIFDELYASAA